MSENVYDVLIQRGFIAQATDEQSVRDALGAGPVTFYVGFDSTATSLHAGSLVPIMAMLHLQRAGHRPIFLTGGGTTMVGDPSGKTEMRQMLSEETIRSYGRGIHSQVNRYFHFDEDQALADYHTLENELRLYNDELLGRRCFVVLNKMDLLADHDRQQTLLSLVFMV